MGYETELLIGSKSSLTGKDRLTGKDVTWFEIFATIKLCECDLDSNLLALDRVNKDKNWSLFWFGSDGDERITTDKYDDRLQPVPIMDVINALKSDLKIEDYNRFRWALSLLESMQNNEYKNITVLLYGY